MQILESLKMALNSIKSNKLRAILTLIGISIGLFSIIIVMTAISAIQSSVEDVFNSIGTTNFIIQKMPAVRMGGPGSFHMYRNRKDLTIEEGEKLKKMTSLPAAVGIALYRGSRTVRYENESTNPNVTLMGANMDEMLTSDLTVAEGRGFNNQDIEYGRNVCVLGYDVADKLFKSIYPVGQEIKIENMNLEVIGVFEKQGSILGQGQDNFAMIPLSYYKKIYGDRRSGTYTIAARSKDLMQKTMDEVIGALRVIRKVPPGEENDFEIITNDQLIEQFNDITKYFKLGAAVIAFIALAAAGVGIMNIMRVSVTERNWDSESYRCKKSYYPITICCRVNSP